VYSARISNYEKADFVRFWHLFCNKCWWFRITSRLWWNISTFCSLFL